MSFIKEMASRLLQEFDAELSRSLSDVGVKGNKLYLAAVADDLSEDFATSRTLTGVAGVSATRDIWKQFSPDAGRSLLFILPADDTLRVNRLVRIGYDNPKKLLANNAALFRRVMPIINVVTWVLQRIDKKVKFAGDVIAVSNMADTIMSRAKRDGNLDGDRLPTHLDKASFGEIGSLGLDLSTPERFANLYLQAAKGSGSYGKAIAKFFAPANRTKWLPLINDAIVAQASIYADEAEWRNLGHSLIVPPGTQVLYAIEAKYINGKPGPLGWMSYEEAAMARQKIVQATLKAAGIKCTVVDYRKTMDSMHAAQARRRLKT